MIRAVLIDLNGTLHVGKSAIPGAVDALERLRGTNIPLKFVTNTTKESKQLLHNKLTSMGFYINLEEIQTSLTACNEIIKNQKLNPMLMVAEEALEDLEVVTNAEKEIDSVVIGLAPKEFVYDRLNEAFKHLMKGAKIVAIHEGRFQADKTGLSLGPGCFIKGLQYVTNCRVDVVGKPQCSFFQAAVPKGISKKEVVVIGDDLIMDIQGAMDCGMQGWLVKTGKFLKKDLEELNITPSRIFPSFVEAVDEIVKVTS